MLNGATQTAVLGPLTVARRSISAAQQLRPEVADNSAALLAIDYDVDAERLMVAGQSAAARFGTLCARLSVDDRGPVVLVDRSFPKTLGFSCRSWLRSARTP